MPRSARRIRREMRSSSESPEVRHRRRIESSSPSPRRARVTTPPPREASEERPQAHPQPTATPSLSIEDIREAVAAEVARAQAPPEGAAQTARGRGRGRARGWGRGRWINFGFYLPHPGPYTPFCRAHREAGCHICIYFCPSTTYMDPQEKGWSIHQ